MTSRVKRRNEGFGRRKFRLMEILIVLASCANRAEAQTIAADSIHNSAQDNIQDSTQNCIRYCTHDNFLERITDTRLFQATYIGVPLIAGGLIEKHQDTKFRKLRNDFMPQFRLSVSYQVKQRLAGTLFLDYNIQAPQSLNCREYMHTMTLGARAAITF